MSPSRRRAIGAVRGLASRAPPRAPLCGPIMRSITHAHYPGGAMGTSRPTAITPAIFARGGSPPRPTAITHARGAPDPQKIARGGSPPLCSYTSRSVALCAPLCLKIPPLRFDCGAPSMAPSSAHTRAHARRPAPPPRSLATPCHLAGFGVQSRSMSAARLHSPRPWGLPTPPRLPSPWRLAYRLWGLPTARAASSAGTFSRRKETSNRKNDTPP